MVCNKCKSDDIIIKHVSIHIGAYCNKCGAWIKWLSKSEKAKFNTSAKTENLKCYDEQTDGDSYDEGDVPW